MAAQENNTISMIDISDPAWTRSPTLGGADNYAGSFGGTYITSTGSYGAIVDCPTQITTPALTVTAGGKIDLQGESADITINGASLKATLEELQERLNWLRPATELEAEWDELRELGDRYRQLEQQCRDKSQMWTKLQTVSKTNQT